MFWGGRVRQVRKLLRWTQTDLAEAIGIRQASVSAIEAGIKQPSAQVEAAIVSQTGFPAGFFSRPPGPDFPLGTLDFRAKRTLAKLDLEQAHAWGELGFEAALELLNRTGRRPSYIPALRGATPEEAAHAARTALGLSPYRPIPNVTYAIEQAGVCVLALPVRLEGRDAFSAWVGDGQSLPFIGIPECASGERLRRSMAHELGHLVMHSGFRGSLVEMEDQANDFASEFLTPAAAIAEYLAPPIRLEGLLELKGVWGVAVQSLVMRAYELGHISERRKQQLFQTIATKWTMKWEPRQLPPEKPRLFRKMVEAEFGVPPNIPRLARELTLPPTLAKALVEAHASRNELRASVSADVTSPTNVTNMRPRNS